MTDQTRAGFSARLFGRGVRLDPQKGSETGADVNYIEPHPPQPLARSRAFEDALWKVVALQASVAAEQGRGPDDQRARHHHRHELLALQLRFPVDPQRSDLVLL